MLKSVRRFTFETETRWMWVLYILLPLLAFLLAMFFPSLTR